MSEKEHEIKALYGTFVFIGTPVINTNNFYSTGISSNGYAYEKVQFGVKTKENNFVFVELNGGYNQSKDNKIFTLTNNNEKLEVNWSDRFNANIIKEVAETRKYKVNFTSSDEKTSEVFLSPHDAVLYIKDNIKPDKRVVVIGNFKVDRFKNSNNEYQTSIKYNPQKIRLAREDEENKAELTVSFVFDKDSWDDSRLKEELKVDITGHTTVYDRTLTPPRNIFIPLNFVLDFNHVFETASVKLTDDNKKLLVGMYKKYFTVKKNEYYETQWKCDVCRGVETKEITINDLSQDQRVMIEFGMTTLEDEIKKMRNKLAGDKVNEIKLLRPTMKYINENTNLPEPNLKTDYKEEDFIIPTIAEETLIDDEMPIKEDPELDMLNKLFPSN